MKKTIFILFISFLLLPVVANAKVYAYGNTFSLESKTIYEPGDVISFSSTICKIMVDRIDTTPAEELNVDECNPTYTVEKKSVFAGERTVFKSVNNSRSMYNTVYLKTIDDNSRFYTADDLILNRVFKSGDLIDYYSSSNGFRFSYYDNNSRIIDDLIMTYPPYKNFYISLPKYEGNDVYWQMKGMLDLGYSGFSPIFQLLDYQKPRFSIECEKKSIKYGEKTNCKVVANSIYPLYEVHFDLDNPGFKILNLKILDNVKEIPGTKKYNLEINEEYANDNQIIELLSFTIEGTKNETYADSITMKSLNYRDSILEGEYEEVQDTINIISEKVNNPKTSTKELLYIIIPVVLFMFGYALISFRKKDIKKKV